MPPSLANSLPPGNANSNPDSSLSDATQSAWLRLANLCFTPRVACALLDAFDDDPEALFAASDDTLMALPVMLPRYRERLRDPANLPTAEQLRVMERLQLRLIRRRDKAYPRALQELADAPPCLFVRGALQADDRFAVALVGSRHATPYGRSVAESLARQLAQRGLTVVSGGAVGIDAAAHRGALAAGGRTLAFVGCGLDVRYPRDHDGLFAQIAEHGALLSEFPVGAQPEAWRFPARNRLISGMAQGVVIVEAPASSGALNTAHHAAEQGRPVMAVPGNIDRAASAGCNQLLKDGAILITDVADVLEALGMVTLPARREHQQTLSFQEATAEAEGDATVPGRTGRTQRLEQTLPATRSRFSAIQQKLLDCLSLTPRHMDAVAQEAGLTSVQASVEMTLLELSGAVQRLPGNAYIRLL